MKNKIILIASVLLLSVSSNAKSKKNPLLKQTSFITGATLASNSKMNSLSLSGNQYWSIGKKKQKFEIGLGARLTSSFGSEQLNYQTAEAKLTSDKTGPGVFFAPQVSENIDTLSLKSTQINSLNAFLALHYNYNNKWGVEFNIDLLGFSFGGSKEGTLAYGEHGEATRKITASPTSRNILLISDNDWGSLNSELLVSYLYKKNLKLKAGASFLFNEYTIDNPVLYTNSIGTVVGTDRYRNKSLCLAVGVNYVIKQKK